MAIRKPRILVRWHTSREDHICGSRPGPETYAFRLCLCRVRRRGILMRKGVMHNHRFWLLMLSRDGNESRTWHTSATKIVWFFGPTHKHCTSFGTTVRNDWLNDVLFCLLESLVQGPWLEHVGYSADSSWNCSPKDHCIGRGQAPVATIGTALGEVGTGGRLEVVRCDVVGLFLEGDGARHHGEAEHAGKNVVSHRFFKFLFV